jgi:positive regulator of sigma E activity
VNETLSLTRREPLPVGAAVDVTLPERFVVLGAGLVYGVPLAALLAGGALGAALFASDLAAAIGAALAVGAALLAAPLWRRWLEKATLRELAVRPAASSAPP